ncbi:hypothetical protein FZEAL_10053 [Fusarium zealandicum]|uniref:Apple domain-containing protein n=1 Tax=Fusarium zealandicum TaxID=1053134 RepID=A0A8H4U5Y3_9HYPO|nr:hypothetical protein FZEAL_10053 [Fusarium zealandicum]
MRFIVALAALALSGTANLAAAGPCKPHSIPTLASTDTATSSSPTETETLPEVTNLASNGNMAEVDPNNLLAVPGWEVDGEAKIVGGQGHGDPGSSERGAAALSASNTDSKKRALGMSVSISQTVSNLDLSTPYTIRFYYLVVTSPQSINLCELTAYLGGAVFHQAWVFSLGGGISWNEVLKSVRPDQVNGPLRIGMNCLLGGGATILVDSVFISNLVTPQNINNFAINFGNTGTGANPPLTPPAVGPQTTAASGTISTSSLPLEAHTSSGFEEQETTTIEQETSSSFQEQETSTDFQHQTSSSFEEQHTSSTESYYTTLWSESATQSSESPPKPTTSSDADPPYCSKSLNGGCSWKRPWSGDDMVNCASRGSWPGSGGQGRLVPRPKGYPEPLSQMWCLGWCSLSLGCKSVAWNPQDRTCRFSEHEVQDADFIHGPDSNLDTEGVYYWHDLSCFNCPCEDEPTTREQETATTSTASEPETTTETSEPTSEPSIAIKLPAASTCPKALNNGCEWNSKQDGNTLCAYRGSWPAEDGAGWAVEQPSDYPTPWSQMWCVAWCALYPGCKSAAWIPNDRTCRFSSHEVQDADFILAADPNQDSLGVYYWHDLSCMTCACNDAPTSATTLIRSVSTQPVLPSGEEQTYSYSTPTTSSPPEPSCDWNNGQGICYRPFEKESGPCGGALKIVNPAQYTLLPIDWIPHISEPVHCAILCHTNPDCFAWGFEWSMNMNCVLSLGQTEVDDLEVVSSGAKYRWYSHTCWECKDCVTSWDWSWGAEPTTIGLPGRASSSIEAYTTTHTPTSTYSETSVPTCASLDQPAELCQRTGHTGNCVGKVDFVNPTNYRKVPMSRFPEQRDAGDVLTCAAICKANADCRAFGWYQGIECVVALDNMSIEDLEWGVTSPQWYMWFNADCFGCDETCVNGQYGWAFD